MLKLLIILSLTFIFLNAKILKVGTPLYKLNSYKFETPHGEKVKIPQKTKLIIITFGKATSKVVNGYLNKKNEQYLQNHNSVFIANLSDIPSIFRSMFIIPKLKKYKYSIYLHYDDKFSKEVPYHKDKITLLFIKNNEIDRVKFIENKKQLEDAFDKEFKNDLQYETSPYLLQHQTNPVKWMRWGEKSFEKAKKEKKIIFLSIGYSTCHWCHVMAKESFENEEIAKLLNENFISIKLDREEYPHIDSYYQELFLSYKGRYGGWPLNIFLTQNLEPFYMDGYIPDLSELLSSLVLAYKDKTYTTINLDKNIDYLDRKISLDSLASSLKNQYDEIYGGFGNGKKFPEVSKLFLMLELAKKLNDKELLEYFYETLDLMALRGLYDHVDGGFFRYSVDEAFEIPHFEKMLYTQAELISLYTKAYQLSSKELYKNVVLESIDMVENRFSYGDLFFSASDADTNHKEGEYFTFTYDEIYNSLKDNPNKKNILKALHLDKEGNFKSKIHLNIYDNKIPYKFDKLKQKLKEIRKTKEYPFIDKKIITSWNAMMIEAYFHAGVFDDKYIKQANSALEALTKLMFYQGTLYHQTVINKKPKQKGILEDYAFFISALLAGYEIDGDKSKLNFAIYLFSKAKHDFYKDATWYLNSDGFKVKAGINDKYYTSPLAKMMLNMLKLNKTKLAKESLNSIVDILKIKQSDAPASAMVYIKFKVK